MEEISSADRRATAKRRRFRYPTQVVAMNRHFTTHRTPRIPIKRELNGEPGNWVLEQQGELLAVAHRDAYYAPQPGKRGRVEYFSPASRLRLLKRLNRVDWPRVGLTQFLCFTYTDELVDGRHTDRTQQRTLLFRWIEKQIGRKASILWKVEWKRRKSGKLKGQVMPHMHLCVFGCRYLSWKACGEKWAELVQAEYVNVKGDRSRGNGVARYCAKYCSKDEPNGDLGLASYLAATRPGRAWGWTRQELTTWAERTEIEHLTGEQVGRALDLARRETGRDVRGGFCLLGSAGKANIRFIIDGCTLHLDSRKSGKYDRKT